MPTAATRRSRSRPPRRWSHGATTRSARQPGGRAGDRLSRCAWPSARRASDAPGLPRAQAPRTLLIACGALAREVLALIALNGWSHMDVTCLPAKLHNPPARIPRRCAPRSAPAVKSHERIVVLYGDCGTGGELDRVLRRRASSACPAPHCYAFYRGVDAFLAEADAEPGLLLSHRLPGPPFRPAGDQGAGPRPPSRAAAAVFRQLHDAGLPRPDRGSGVWSARRARRPQRLGLAYEHRPTGYGGLAAFLRQAAERWPSWSSSPGATSRPR